MTMPRRVTPEWLDSLSPSDPRAIRSRSDLRRVNWLMANDLLVANALTPIFNRRPATDLVDLGAGDGTTLLRFARRHARHRPGITVHLLDQAPVVNAATIESYERLGWRVAVVAADVFEFLGRPQFSSPPVIVANLFVHHFDEERLRALFVAIAGQAAAFVGCEPRRSRFALAFSRMLGVIGCNDVTRHDAAASVWAGFAARELTSLWPDPAGWDLREGRAGPFSHRFSAVASA